jgi:putative serine protease PepD
LGNPRTLQVGDPIYAIGNPLGLTGSISAGIISGLNRDIPFPGEEGLVFENLIQFDAAVNQGSSGGPLLNAQGHVVGIVTALADPAGQGFFIGIGFAVPIDRAASGAADGPSQ